MPTIEQSTVIERPVDEVWPLFEDVRRLPEFSPSTTQVTDAPERLTHPGQTFKQVVRKLGKCFESEWVVIHVDPGHELTIEGTIGMGVKYRITEKVAALDAERTTASLIIDYKLPFGPLGRMAGKLGVEKLAAAEAGLVLQGLKDLLESEPARRGPATV